MNTYLFKPLVKGQYFTAVLLSAFTMLSACSGDDSAPSPSPASKPRAAAGVIHDSSWSSEKKESASHDGDKGDGPSCVMATK